MKLEIKNIRFGYGNLDVLDDVSFNAEQGDVIGIIGPNGAGKTTLLKIIDGILMPREGKVLVGNKSLSDIQREVLARTIGYIPQSEFGTFPSTVFDTILMGRKPYFSWAPNNEDLRITSQIIYELGLEELSLRRITEMSGGQRQKVIFGRALAQDPAILLLDEPTANLDLKHQLEILGLLQQLAGRGKIVVLAIHDLNMALKFCNKFVMLHENKVFAEGNLEIITPENIERVYGVQVTVLHHHGQMYVLPEAPIQEQALEGLASCARQEITTS